MMIFGLTGYIVILCLSIISFCMMCAFIEGGKQRVGMFFALSGMFFTGVLVAFSITIACGVGLGFSLLINLLIGVGA